VRLLRGLRRFVLLLAVALLLRRLAAVAVAAAALSIAVVAMGRGAVTDLYAVVTKPIDCLLGCCRNGARSMSLASGSVSLLSPRAVVDAVRLSLWRSLGLALSLLMPECWWHCCGLLALLP
jgi:hypothetical protein